MKNISVSNLNLMLNKIIEDANAYIAAAEKHISALRNTRLENDAATIDGSVLADLCEAARKLSMGVHEAKFFYDWRNQPEPEWFDHYLDQYYQFPEQRISFWVERGVYGVLALRPGADILELCCGDGFNTAHFYQTFAKQLIAVDFDATAIAHARRFNASPKIDYRLADIRTEMPAGTFSNIIWDAAIEHFTEAEIASIMDQIKSRLTPDGILSGYTLVEKDDGHKHLHQHEREFRSMEDLSNFLTPHFANVQVFETIFPTRHNLYFWASDQPVPFHPDWAHGLSRFRASP